MDDDAADRFLRFGLRQHALDRVQGFETALLFSRLMRCEGDLYHVVFQPGASLIELLLLQLLYRLPHEDRRSRIRVRTESAARLQDRGKTLALANWIWSGSHHLTLQHDMPWQVPIRGLLDQQLVAGLEGDIIRFRRVQH